MANKKPENMTFEAAMDELDTIIQHLEQGNIPLDDALRQFERGIGLVRSSQARLEKAQQQVQRLTEDNQLVPFNLEQGE